MVEGDLNGPTRLSSDFVASGESAMLAWKPPKAAEFVTPLANSMTLVRFLGGLSATKHHPDPSVGDVVYRASDGTLIVRWTLVWARLDPFVNNSIAPVIVLDNVPYCFCQEPHCNVSVQSHSTGYGNSMGPSNVTEYGSFIRTLLRGLVKRYGVQKTNSFWFRVGTEPNTQPAHWNDTNAKFIDMYVEVAKAVTAEVPSATLGPSNFASDGMGRTDHRWSSVVVPIMKGIITAGARVDFLAMSCYGRAILCHEPKTTASTGGDFGATTAKTPTDGAVDKNDTACEYSAQFASHCAERLSSLRGLLPVTARAIPIQSMEYGTQENSLKIRDYEPGAWGGAWTAASSIQFALSGVNRVYRGLDYGDPGFANGQTTCAAPLSKCGLYGSNMWVAAAAGHLFGANSSAAILGGSNDSNIINPDAKKPGDGGVSASGIGGWGDIAGGAVGGAVGSAVGDGGELRLLVSLFSARKDVHEQAKLTVVFERPAAWVGTPLKLRQRSMVLDNTTSVYDAIRQDAAQKGYLLNASDPNVYGVSKMLTAAGVKAAKTNAERWLAMQRLSFTPSDWAPVSEMEALGLTCSCSGSTCNVTFVAAPPVVLGLWLAPSR
jgi:hypothetical protein